MDTKTQDYLDRLNESLETNFTDSIFSVAKTRISSMTEGNEILLYVSILSSGICKRHPDLEYWFILEFAKNVTWDAEPRLIDMDAAYRRLLPIALGDILTALGKLDRSQSDDGIELWSANEFDAIDKVWHGQISLAVVADEIRKQSE
jgi:hypothetical protein